MLIVFAALTIAYVQVQAQQSVASKIIIIIIKLMVGGSRYSTIVQALD